MTVQEWQAQAIETVGKTLAFWVGTTREDKLDWTPKVDETSNTRSVLNVAQECVAVNRRMAALLRGETVPGTPPEGESLSGAADAQEQLTSSAKELADVVRSLDDEALSRLYPTPFGQIPGSMLTQIAANNMSYHGGQVNYIQRLYGDIEFRFPGRS